MDGKRRGFSFSGVSKWLLVLLSFSFLLQRVFKNNNIQFHVNPIESYAELEDKAAQNGGLGSKAVVLVNIGGTEDIREVLGTDESTLIVIIDSRRPISHSYVPKSNDNIMILCDEEDEANPIMGK